MSLFRIVKNEIALVPNEEDRLFDILFENGSFGMYGDNGFIPLCDWNLSLFKI